MCLLIELEFTINFIFFLIEISIYLVAISFANVFIKFSITYELITYRMHFLGLYVI